METARIGTISSNMIIVDDVVKINKTFSKNIIPIRKIQSVQLVEGKLGSGGYIFINTDNFDVNKQITFIQAANDNNAIYFSLTQNKNAREFYKVIIKKLLYAKDNGDRNINDFDINKSYCEFLENNFKNRFDTFGSECVAWSKRYDIQKKLKLEEDEYITMVYYSFAFLKRNQYVIVQTNKNYHELCMIKEQFDKFNINEIEIERLNKNVFNINGIQYVEITIASDKINDYLADEIDSSITTTMGRLFLVRKNIIDIIARAIENKTFNLSGKLVHFFENKQMISNNSHVYNKDFFKLADKVHNLTLKVVDDYALEKLGNYNLVEVTRSSNQKVSVGTYFYKFDSLDNLHILRTPYVTISVPVYDEVTKKYKTNESGNIISKQKLIYDQSLEEEIIVINKDDIRDFQIFGTQLMESNVYINNQKPKLLGTIVSEFIFGESYTLLKGLNKNTLGTSHTINDARVVQILFNDKSDLEFKGVSIYFEFNRLMGNIKNKQVDQVPQQEQSPSYLEELKALKELLDLGILTEDEFSQKKAKILNLN